MFGEEHSESPKRASPWATPSRAQTPSSSLSLSLSQPLSSLASSSSSLHKSSSEEAEIFSGEVTSSGSDEDDVEELRDQLAASSSFSSPGAVGGAGRRSTVDTSESRPRRLSAEDDDKGHIEYKLKLTAATPDRFNRLVTQLKWRLLQGGGEAMYEIGVLDDGTLVGLSRTDLLASLRTLERMADELGATVVVLKEIRLEKNESTGSAGDDGGKRRRWEQWKAFADEKEKVAAAIAKELSPKKPSSKSVDPSSSSNGPPSSTSPSSSTPILGQSKSPTTNAISYSPNYAISPIADLPSSISATTDELHILLKAQDRASMKKRNTSILDDHPVEPSHHFGATSVPTSKANKVRRHRPIKKELVESDDEGGMFSVFDLDLDASIPPPKVKPTPKVSRKKAYEDEKAARRKLKRALKDEKSMRCLWGGGEEVVVGGGDEDDDGGWAGQSLDVWGDDGGEVEQQPHTNSNGVVPSTPLDAEVEPFSLPPSDHHLVPLPPSSSTSSSSSSISIPSTSPTNTITSFKPPTTPPTSLSTSLTPSPSPLLLPTYRPPSSLLSTTPRAGFPPIRLPKRGETPSQEIEDGSERICVEALVVRKEMEGHLNFEDVGRWMSGGGKWGEEDPLVSLAALV